LPSVNVLNGSTDQTYLSCSFFGSLYVYSGVYLLETTSNLLAINASVSNF